VLLLLLLLLPSAATTGSNLAGAWLHCCPQVMHVHNVFPEVLDSLMLLCAAAAPVQGTSGLPLLPLRAVLPSRLLLLSCGYNAAAAALEASTPVHTDSPA
jgi:hypothetical protein